MRGESADHRSISTASSSRAARRRRIDLELDPRSPVVGGDELTRSRKARHGPHRHLPHELRLRAAALRADASSRAPARAASSPRRLSVAIDAREVDQRVRADDGAAQPLRRGGRARRRLLGSRRAACSRCPSACSAARTAPASARSAASPSTTSIPPSIGTSASPIRGSRSCARCSSRRGPGRSQSASSPLEETPARALSGEIGPGPANEEQAPRGKRLVSSPQT